MLMPETPGSLALYDELISQLAARRHEKNISQRDLDDIIGCASGLVGKWESKSRRPSAWNLACWLSALECRVHINGQKSER
tara:strand:- start:7904 stop:8146 length:243 start_codon:yes stop_codon:yes gene_type:complete